MTPAIVSRLLFTADIISWYRVSNQFVEWTTNLLDERLSGFFLKDKTKKKKNEEEKKKKYRFNVVTCYTNSFYSIERETLLDENTRGEGKKEEINDRFHYYIGLAVISDGGERWRKVPWLSMRSIMATRGHFIEFQGKNSDYSRAIKAAGSPIRWDLAAW